MRPVYLRNRLLSSYHPDFDMKLVPHTRRAITFQIVVAVDGVSLPCTFGILSGAKSVAGTNAILEPPR